MVGSYGRAPRRPRRARRGEGGSRWASAEPGAPATGWGVRRDPRTDRIYDDPASLMRSPGGACLAGDATIAGSRPRPARARPSGRSGVGARRRQTSAHLALPISEVRRARNLRPPISGTFTFQGINPKPPTPRAATTHCVGDGARGCRCARRPPGPTRRGRASCSFVYNSPSAGVRTGRTFAPTTVPRTSLPMRTARSVGSGSLDSVSRTRRWQGAGREQLIEPPNTRTGRAKVNEPVQSFAARV
jgi:hypothetical protein